MAGPLTHAVSVPAAPVSLPPPTTPSAATSASAPDSGTASAPDSGAPVTTTAKPTATPSVWPASAAPAPGGDITISGVSLAGLAERYGTPTYVLDEDEVRARARAWRRALPDAEIVYAGKAFLCRAVVDWIEEEGLGLDVCSAGELELAATRGFPADRIVLHGNAKSPEDLRSALRIGVGRIVIDSDCEIARIAAQVQGPGAQQVMVRVLPGIEAGGHKKIRTGAEGQKFGLSIAGGDAEDAVSRILGQPSLELVGLHCHLGSQITTPEPYAQAVRRLVAFLARIHDRYGITLRELDLGGGFAVPYLPDDPAPSPAWFGRRISDELLRACDEFDFPMPRLTVEPGRSIMAPAGVALYRVLSVKRSGGQVFVAVDGGMSDNLRPALYGARYAIRMVGRVPSGPMRATTVVGRHCEAGDVLAESVELPEDVRPGDVLAVPVSGAYHVSMASGYNTTGRPPVVAVAAVGRSRLLVRRESIDDLLRRDVGL
ncbi:diaminopimelate decarboxylase [Streptomyces sp. MS1.AVA.4]|uniref:Diaminopimelate decarboxylase n=1 Tax=Streptomyces pratisoli TaxID=3139917 RepID=A0ACC6QQY9_9ACTN